MNEELNILEPETPILIVDDNPQYTVVLTKILEGIFGYKNITAIDNLEEAFNKLKSGEGVYKLLFVDYRFPSGTTGTEFLLKMKEHELLNDKVAFLITSEPSPENLKQAISAGAQALITKPFNREQLKSQLDKAQRYLWAKSRDYF